MTNNIYWQKVAEIADKAGLIEVLTKIVSWQMNPNDPNDFRRQQEAIDLINHLAKGDDYEHIARVFLHNHSDQLAVREG